MFEAGVQAPMASDSIVTDLTGRHEEPDGPPTCIGYSVQLGVHTALCSPDQTSTPPFLTPRLEAVRCALSLSSLQAVIVGQWVSRIDGDHLVMGHTLAAHRASPNHCN